MIKQLRNTLLVLIGSALLLAIIFNEFIAYSAIFVSGLIVFYGLYYAFLKTKDDEIEQLKETLDSQVEANKAVLTENEDLRSRKLNISAVKQILDIGLFEIDSNFTRTWNEEMEITEGRSVQFIGALKVTLKAKYGIDLTDVNIERVDDHIEISNLHLKSLSFTDLQYDWVISELLEIKKPYLGKAHRRTDTLLELEATRIKERLQKRIHEEIKQGPEEYHAIIQILKTQLKHSVASVLGIQDKEVRFIDFDEGSENHQHIEQSFSAGETN